MNVDFERAAFGSAWTEALPGIWEYGRSVYPQMKSVESRACGVDTWKADVIRSADCGFAFVYGHTHHTRPKRHATQKTRDPKKHATHEMRRGSRCEPSAHPSRLREPSMVSKHWSCNHRGAELRSRGVRTDDLANEIL